MAYSDKVLDHYENPRNVGSFGKDDDTVGTGMVGAPACGDVMKLQIRVGANGIIEDVKIKTYGCGSAIASSSYTSEWLKGTAIIIIPSHIICMYVPSTFIKRLFVLYYIIYCIVFYCNCLI